MPSLKYSPYLALVPPVGISILPAMAWLAMNVQIEQQLLTGCKIKRKYHTDEKSGIDFEVWRLVVADFVDYGEQKQSSMVGRAALRKLRRFNLKTWGLELAPDHCELPMGCPQTMTHFD